MFDIGWTEMLVIAMLALVIIGPKDLPGALRTVGQWVRKARSLAREFQSGVDEMVREAELDEARKALEATKRGNLAKSLTEAVDPSGELSAEAKAIETSARKATQIEEGAGTASATGKGATEKAGTGTGAAETAAPEAPQAKVVKHPAKVAPGNSIRPPQEPMPGDESAAAGDTVGDTVGDTAPETEESASKAG